MEAIAHDAERIQALSRTQPHVFLEQKDMIAKRLRKLASDLRNTFGGAPHPGDDAQQRFRIVPGRRTMARGREVRVEIRKARVA